MKLFNNFRKFSRIKILFFFLGISSLIWFIIRVIPKPSRAAYPCMRVATPLMSAFILYLVSLASTLLVFKKTNQSFMRSRFVLSFVFIIVLLLSFTKSDTKQKNNILLSPDSFIANEPIGVAKGIYPGRVVWVRDPNATNENMTNQSNDYWYMDKNCSQTVVDSLFASGIKDLAGKDDIHTAWDAIFKYFNKKHNKGEKGYTTGEKFAVKINLVNSGSPESLNTSPQLCLALLKQLIEVVGVKQQDIWLGDNYKYFDNEHWNKLHPIYPNVHYIDNIGSDGREQTVPTKSKLVLFFSDGANISSLPQHYIDASYLINLACLKSHDRGGVILTAKNHNGSILQGIDPGAQSAEFMHYSLPGGGGDPSQGSPGYGKYRHLVDYMGHKDLGGKTLFYLVDGLWAGRNWNGIIEKWQMAPFNNDYPSSLFLSLDAVAIESVCFDFLLTEYASKSDEIKYPYINGTDDYMKQAADRSYWPTGIYYAPDPDGFLIHSLGVYEHWNNPSDKQYSRNLGTGKGIELKAKDVTTTATLDKVEEVDNTSIERIERSANNWKLYPNPFTESIYLEIKQLRAYLNIYNLNGQKIYQAELRNSFKWDGKTQNGSRISPGTYIFIATDMKSNKVILNEKVVFKKK